MGLNKSNRFIILKKVRYGEADLILQALSHEGERVSFIARAALKSKTRFGGGILEPTHFVEFTYREARNANGLNILNEAKLIDGFYGLREDYDKIQTALSWLAMVRKVSLEGDALSSFLFNLLGHGLRRLSETKENWEVLDLQFCLKFLYQQGVLTFENWMTDFLKNPMGESAVTSAVQLPQIKEWVRHYLQSADSSNFAATDFAKGGIDEPLG